MKLNGIEEINGTIHLITGLHIGGSDVEMGIGGNDNQVVKHPLTGKPYIPGSSIKGKMRSMLEWDLGVVGTTNGQPLGFDHLPKVDSQNQEEAKNLLKLFGAAPPSVSNTDEKLVKEIGPARLAFRDCQLSKNQLTSFETPFETKTENRIDRIKGTAEHPRHMERVASGINFDFKLTLRVHGEDDASKTALREMILKGFWLVEMIGLGGSVSRGYGQVQFDLQDFGDFAWGDKLNALRNARGHQDLAA